MRVTVRFYGSDDRLLETRKVDISATSEAGPGLRIPVSPDPDGAVRATVSWPQNASGSPVTIPAGTVIRWA